MGMTKMPLLRMLFEEPLDLPSQFLDLIPSGFTLDLVEVNNPRRLVFTNKIDFSRPTNLIKIPVLKTTVLKTEELYHVAPSEVNCPPPIT